MIHANEVVRIDLEYISHTLEEEFNELAGKKILITGGAGFLGYYLVQSILFRNRSVSGNNRAEIILYDNYIRGIPDWLKELEKDPCLTLVTHDITNPLPETNTLFDYIIHAASIASPMYYREYPLETMDANVNGLRYLLEYARKRADSGNPVEGFLNFSTSEIYGDPDTANIPTPETYRGNVSCTGPRACYDESKRYGETLCVTFAQKYGVNVKIARPFNNFGPGLKITDKRVIPDFMRNILNGDDIVMHSDGRPSRTFCYIADAITGYFKILVKGRRGESYNIGVSEPEITMAELAEKLVAIARDEIGYAGRVIHKPSSDENYLVDNPNRRCPIIDKARAELGYDPKITLEDGLRRNFIWYKENMEAVEA
jgi:UDP-glucuronate decarboxylase